MKFKGTQGQWSIMEQFTKPNLIEDTENNTEWYSLSSYIFGDDKLLGEVEYKTRNTNGGFKGVDVLSEFRANAKLIAAAPELLKALQDIHQFNKSTFNGMGQDYEAMMQLSQQAINKALK